MKMYIYWLYEIPLWLNMVLFLLVLLVSMEAGYQMGLRKHRANPDSQQLTRGDVTVASMFALLGLMLAFTYAFSMSRADMRKKAFVTEVNAIGTAFLRADLAPEPGRTELRERLLDYARSRLVTPEMVRNREQLLEVIARSLEAQAKLWPATKSALQIEGDMPGPLKASLVQAVNEVLDAHTSRMAVIYDRLPSSVLVLLLLIAAVSMALTAYNSGLSGHICRWRMSAFAVILAALMFVILDFDMILRGFIRVSHESLASLIREMEAAILQ
jgi:hypothetical protein